MIASPVTGQFKTIAGAAKASLEWVATYERTRYIVKDENGAFTSIPSKYLHDVSYTGSKDVVAKVIPA